MARPAGRSALVTAFVLLSGASALAQADAGRKAASDKATIDLPTIDLAAIEACFASAKGDPGRGACIGRVSRPCIDAADGSGTSTAAMNDCYGREIAAWDTLLNRRYKQVSAAMDEAGRGYLRDAQRAWLGFRQKACEWPAQVYPGGSIQGPLGGECLQVQTARRVLDLDQIRAALSER